MTIHLTVDRLNEREVEWEETFRWRTYRTRYRLPVDAERLFTGQDASACLTHITRHVADSYKRDGSGAWALRGPRPHAWCGYVGIQYDTVPVEDESFACHKCVALAERHGGDTFNMIPNTGCEATGGARWRVDNRQRSFITPKEQR